MDSTRYRIRPARREHAALLPEIGVAAATLFPDEDIAPELRAESLPESAFSTAAEEGRLWVAVLADSDAPVGFAMARIVDASAHLFELDVHPDHGRRGLGARLIDAVAGWARARGDTGLTLTTFIHLPWNAPYYARLGFAPIAAEARGPELRALLHAEVESGLDPDKRIAMRLAIE